MTQNDTSVPTPPTRVPASSNDEKHTSTSENKRSQERTDNMVDDTPTDDILLDVREVCGYKIRRVSFGKLSIITPMLAALVDKVQRIHPSGVVGLTAVEIATIIMTMMPDLIPVVAKIVEAPEADIMELDAQAGIELAFTIWTVNSQLFTSFFMIGSTLSASQR